MSSPTLFLLLSPFFVVAAIYGAAVIVALVRARQEDIPAVLREANAIFARLVDRASHPKVKGSPFVPGTAGEPGVLGEDAPVAIETNPGC